MVFVSSLLQLLQLLQLNKLDKNMEEGGWLMQTLYGPKTEGLST